MATVYEVALRASNQGRVHNNIFHVFDGNDNADLSAVADHFETAYCVAMIPVLSDRFTFNQITVISLTAVNPATFVKTISRTGLVFSDPMPTGVHVYAKLLSADQSFRSGGKLIGGVLEENFDDGQPSDSLLDFIQSRYDDFRVGLNPAVGVDLAIYRPTFSLPGIPSVSIVQDTLIRGASTNNRRKRDFKR